MSTPELVIVDERADTAAAVRLLGNFVADIRSLYPAFDPQVGPSARPEDFEAPHGAFVVAYLDGRPVGCCGVKSLGGVFAEIKRLWVAPEGRGLGLGRRLLEACELRASAMGATVVRLDTGDRQPEAFELFKSVGYEMIDDYNDNPFASYWLERRLPTAEGCD